MYCCFSFVYFKTIFESAEMRILQTIILLLLIACQSEKSEKDIKPGQSQSNLVQESSKESTQQPQKITNGIVFKDAQGNILSDTEKDSLVQFMENIQALRSYNQENNNTEYILFQNYEDLRGFVPDDTIENLIEENRLRRSGGQGAVLSKRINDQWKDKPLPEGNFLQMIDGSVKSFSDYKGKLLVINFWYINCGPCIIEMPYLNDLVNKYQNEDVQFLALSFDTVLDIKSFLQKTEFIYEHGSISRSLMYDFTPVSPGHFIVDKDGIIRDITIGAPRNTEIIFDKLVNLIEKNKK
jgi:thiol-disulfide isomerase/thioredoxin|tara:strand:+ start:1189 stop:2076 length:888 start_codon:yes stop_codon:yes gene_type:complete